MSSDANFPQPTVSDSITIVSLEKIRRWSLLLLTLAALWAGWNIRDEYYINAERGIGYALGISGGVMMLLLLLYPLKKRLPRSGWLILSTSAWFRFHMLLGLVGPICILYHCNFSLGSTNSNVALGSMLLMVTSGLIGRYIYSKIHIGLYGKKIELSTLMSEKAHIEKRFLQFSKDNQAGGHKASLYLQPLQRYEKQVSQRHNLLYSFFQIIGLAFTTRINYQKISRQYAHNLTQITAFNNLTSEQQKRHLQRTNQTLSRYLTCIRRIADLAFFERLFSLWHMLHLPIFFMLLISGFIHVYAVHAY